MNTIRLIVRARGNDKPYITIVGPTVVPRVGEYVVFDDGSSRPSAGCLCASLGDDSPADLDVVVECRPKLSAFASREPS
jgi:hypothetical protein